MICNVKWGRMFDDVKIPTKRDEDGGYDIYARFDDLLVVVPPHKTVMLHTGLVSAFDIGFVAILKERGSTGTKGMGQRAGVVDCGYRGEWMVPITNHNDSYLLIIKDEQILESINDPRITEIVLKDTDGKNHIIDLKTAVVHPYTKAITQAVFLPIPTMNSEEATVEEIQAMASQRGVGKLGSSGK